MGQGVPSLLIPMIYSLGNWRHWRKGAQVVADVLCPGRTGAEPRTDRQEQREGDKKREKVPWSWLQPPLRKAARSKRY